jgi:hypothetical protein
VNKPQGYRQSAAETCFCLLVLCLPYWQSLLLAGMSGALSVLLLTCLLMFVAGRASEIFETLTDRLHGLLAGWIAPAFRDRGFRSARPWQVVAEGPTLEPWFQRPPPLFS